MSGVRRDQSTALSHSNNCRFARSYSRLQQPEHVVRETVREGRCSASPLLHSPFTLSSPCVPFPSARASLLTVRWLGASRLSRTSGNVEGALRALDGDGRTPHRLRRFSAISADIHLGTPETWIYRHRQVLRFA